MFFPERITSIQTNDKVLEIGPGGNPHRRADIFLEKLYHDPIVAKGQRGYAPPLTTNKKIIYYEDNFFPFEDNQFDYVICSHVLEHVEDIDIFISEINRVANKGYLEYPTIYYDYIYNFPEHKSFILNKNNRINWMLKTETSLHDFTHVNAFFYQSLIKGYSGMVDELKTFLFEGFEWFGALESQHVTDLDFVCFDANEMIMPEKHKKDEIVVNEIQSKHNNVIFDIFNKLIKR